MKTNIRFLIITRSVLPRIRNVSGKRSRENQNTFFVQEHFFFFENRAFDEIMWKDFVKRGRPQMTIWRMRISCFITKATNTHSQYVILIAIPLKQRLHETTSMLRTLPVIFRLVYLLSGDWRFSILLIFRTACFLILSFILWTPHKHNKSQFLSTCFSVSVHFGVVWNN